jgi:hypothetical protein
VPRNASQPIIGESSVADRVEESIDRLPIDQQSAPMIRVDAADADAPIVRFVDASTRADR